MCDLNLDGFFNSTDALIALRIVSGGLAAAPDVRKLGDLAF